MGLPIPFVFFWQDDNGRMEIVDGSQRIRTVKGFMEDEFYLKGLETIPAANGLKYSDLPHARQLKFAETPIRVIILDNSTDAITRTEMFARINTGGTIANDAEIRRGSLPGPFMDLIIELAGSDQFVELTPVSTSLANKREREELVTRFFAYLESFDQGEGLGAGDIPGYKDDPRRFYFNFTESMNKTIQEEIDTSGQSKIRENLSEEFLHVLDFVRQTSPFGFTKSASGKQVPRVRFESIAIGSALALRKDPTIFQRVPNISPLINSDDFLKVTKSDAANVKSKLLGRIILTRDWLLQQ
ncbi:hypothetical protein A6D6_04122 [Alcanivorax xiamenensis]|uniref:GmrSD restriction endonucleases N-terminal domain-containing protein n=2 Tax=Alcanivorax xiamenensis TaxID=1177156 RepID=A0ABQ6Y2G6_9GAMM|nr:hypothetical protein A6D6_04122 [Alcanivorax xiamenensis]